jgi:hypothetical protein
VEFTIRSETEPKYEALQEYAHFTVLEIQCEIFVEETPLLGGWGLMKS